MKPGPDFRQKEGEERGREGEHFVCAVAAAGPGMSLVMCVCTHLCVSAWWNPCVRVCVRVSQCARVRVSYDGCKVGATSPGAAAKWFKKGRKYFSALRQQQPPLCHTAEPREPGE